MRLEGKTALVTGAASGFGKAIATRFAAEGAKVLIVDLNSAAAQELADTLGSTAITCDVSDAAAMRSMAARAEAEIGSIDIVVNNAGYSHSNRSLLEVDETEMRKVFDINVMSIYHSVQEFLPRWRARGEGGVMLNIGSTAGISPRPGLTWYNASKGAVNLLSRSLAAELASDNIRVNCIAPVIGSTGLLETFMGKPDTPENRAKFIATIPMGRMSEPEDIANAALYLCSDEAAFITGVVLEVDGGRTI